MSCVWRRECQARQRNTCAVMKVHPRMIRMNRNENMWCIIITAHPKIDGKLGTDAKKQPQTNIECLRTAHPSLHMTEYHRLIYLHSFLNQSFRGSFHAKSANTHIPPAAGAQYQPSNRWAIFWGPHLLWLSSWKCNAGFAVTLQKSLWLVRYIFTFEWAVPLKESWEIWGNADIVFALRSVSRTPVEYQAQTRHPWARMNSAYVTPVTDAAAQTHPWLVVLFSFGWLALGMKRVGVNMSGWANQRQSRVYFSVCEVSTNKVDQCTWSNTSL